MKPEIYHDIKNKKKPSKKKYSEEEALLITLEMMDFYAKIRERSSTNIEKYGYEIDWITLEWK